MNISRLEYLKTLGELEQNYYNNYRSFLGKKLNKDKSIKISTIFQIVGIIFITVITVLTGLIDTDFIFVFDKGFVFWTLIMTLLYFLFLGDDIFLDCFMKSTTERKQYYDEYFNNHSIFKDDIYLPKFHNLLKEDFYILKVCECNYDEQKYFVEITENGITRMATIKIQDFAWLQLKG